MRERERERERVNILQIKPRADIHLSGMIFVSHKSYYNSVVNNQVHQPKKNLVPKRLMKSLIGLVVAQARNV